MTDSDYEKTLDTFRKIYEGTHWTTEEAHKHFGKFSGHQLLQIATLEMKKINTILEETFPEIVTHE